MASDAPAVTDGPVMTLINKRIRNHRKKLNRIANMEESLSQGKALNTEQLEVLRSKPAIVAQIEELEKLKAPLASALSEELSVAAASAAIGKKEDEKKEEEEEGNGVVEDMLRLIYFGMLFDVKSQGDFNSVMLTRSHERGCCLTYDCVTDDDVSAADLLGENDLDIISMLGGLLISRPVDSSLSHKNALERCVEHAKLWLAKADQPIDPNNAGITYASLRDRLNKILSSDYFTTTPEMRAPDEVAAAAAAGSYAAFQVPAQEVVVMEDQQKEESADIQGNESGDNQFNPEEPKNDEVEAENLEEAMPEQEVKPQAEEEHAESEKNGESGEQQHVPRRPYQNQRGRGGGRRGGFYYGRGGGRRGGGYQNGRHQYYDQHEYIDRTYQRGRGGRGAGHYYNRHARSVQSGQAANETVAS